MHKAIKRFAAAPTLFLAVILLSRNSHALLPVEIETKINPVIVETMTCSVLKATFNERISALNEYKSNNLETYTKLVDRVEQMIEKWEGWGYNVGKVEDDLDELNELIEEFEQDYDDLITKTTAARDACGSSGYSSKLNTAKEALKEVRGDVVSIRVHYQTVLRKHVVEIKSQEL